MGFSEQAGAELHSAWILIKKTQIFVIILPATAGAGPEAGSLATAYPAVKELWGWGEDTVSPLGGPNVTAISPAHHPARKGWQPVSQLLSPSTRCPKELPLLLLCVPVPRSPKSTRAALLLGGALCLAFSPSNPVRPPSPCPSPAAPLVRRHRVWGLRKGHLEGEARPGARAQRCHLPPGPEPSPCRSFCPASPSADSNLHLQAQAGSASPCPPLICTCPWHSVLAPGFWQKTGAQGLSDDE